MQFLQALEASMLRVGLQFLLPVTCIDQEVTHTYCRRM